jgi:hypothetical protein
MKISEVHYFWVSNGDTANYYRLRVDGQTSLGVAQFRSGWYPARAVDSLFGSVSSDGAIAALEARNQIEMDISGKILSTNKAWLDAAADVNSTPDKLARLLEARRRVLAYPNSAKPPMEGAFEMEFNPAKGVALFHADEKLVFILSSNPDEVVGKIKNFAESEQTVLSINQLSKVVVQRSRNAAGAQTAVEDVNKKSDVLVLAQLKKSLVTAKNLETPRADAIREIDLLLNLVTAVQR